MELSKLKPSYQNYVNTLLMGFVDSNDRWEIKFDQHLFSAMLLAKCCQAIESYPIAGCQLTYVAEYVVESLLALRDGRVDWTINDQGKVTPVNPYDLDHVTHDIFETIHQFIGKYNEPSDTQAFDGLGLS
jgi:hypothetical protein